MKADDFLRKSGIMRSGAVAGTYKNGKDRPTELMMDDVYNAKKDLVTDNESKNKKMPISDNGDQPPLVDNSSQLPQNPKPKWIKYTIITGLVLFVLLIFVAIFGTPSAEKVFNDSLDEMLQTESVVIEQEFSGSGAGLSSISLKADSYLEMPEGQDLKAKGTMSLDITNEGIPIVAEAEYISVDGGNYIKFTKLSSSNPTYKTALEQIEGKLNDKWVKARSGDSFGSFVEIPIDAITSVTALPYANLDDETREKIVAVLQDEEAFTIIESAQVEVNGQSAYRYELEFDEARQEEVAKQLGDAFEYFKDDDGEDSAKIEKLELWVDISTKRFIKMEYSGTSKQGNISAVINYSGYNETMDVTKPDEYYVESELIQ